MSKNKLKRIKKEEEEDEEEDVKMKRDRENGELCGEKGRESGGGINEKNTKPILSLFCIESIVK